LDVSSLDLATESDVQKTCYDGIAAQEVDVKGVTARCC